MDRERHALIQVSLKPWQGGGDTFDITDRIDQFRASLGAKDDRPFIVSPVGMSAGFAIFHCSWWEWKDDQHAK